MRIDKFSITACGIFFVMFTCQLIAALPPEINLLYPHQRNEITDRIHQLDRRAEDWRNLANLSAKALAVIAKTASLLVSCLPAISGYGRPKAAPLRFARDSPGPRHQSAGQSLTTSTTTRPMRPQQRRLTLDDIEQLLFLTE